MLSSRSFSLSLFSFSLSLSFFLIVSSFYMLILLLDRTKRHQNGGLKKKKNNSFVLHPPRSLSLSIDLSVHLYRLPSLHRIVHRNASRSPSDGHSGEIVFLFLFLSLSFSLSLSVLVIDRFTFLRLVSQHRSEDSCGTPSSPPPPVHDTPRLSSKKPHIATVHSPHDTSPLRYIASRY